MHTGEHDLLGASAMQLRSTVVEYEDAPDECTIFPGNVAGCERTTTWITAEEGAFVELERFA